MSEEKQEPTTQVCKCCGKELPISDFTVKGNRFGNYHEKTCIACKAAKKANRAINVGGNPKLRDFTSRELIEELRIRGYKGTLFYTKRYEITV